jgi:protocatechuate 3,4-dioxygenase beta subunit
MSRLFFACLVWLLLASPFAAAQQFTVQGPVNGANSAGPRPQVTNQLQDGTATIRGRVVAADNGQPLRRAVVRVGASGRPGNRSALTDANGQFEMARLPAGRYTLTATKDGFVNLSFGQSNPTQMAKNIDVTDGQVLANVDFRLPRSGVIAGRVIDEFGDPVLNAQVTALRTQYQQGQKRFTMSGRPGSTNDIGEFRVFGLNPGTYYISVAMPRGPQAGVGPLDNPDDGTGYAPIYYPGTPDASLAQSIVVGSGETVAGISLQLAPVHTSKISGTAYDGQGQPLRGGTVMVGQSRNGLTNQTTGGQIKQDGSFVVSNLAPGDYILQAPITQTRGPQTPGVRPTFARAAVTITGTDVTYVVLAPVPLATASGRLVFNGSGEVQPSSIRITATPFQLEPIPGPPSPPTPIKDDLTFAIQVQPGRVNVRPTLSGDSVEGIEIDVTSHPPEVSGAVTNDHNEAATTYTVLLFPRNRGLWTTNSRGFAFLRPDKDGRFKSRSLPPDRYYAIALDSVDQNEWRDPDYLGRVARDATQFSLSDGEQKSLDLKLH